MQNDIMVTVMVTFYNQKQYIKDSLGSIFNQETNFCYEVLCGDDGSTDGTYEELLRWKEQYSDRCFVFRMPREQGKKYEPIVRVSKNRVNLLKYAKGKYVTFLDGDDYYTDVNKLQKQVTLLEKYSDCVACGHPVTMLWDGESEKKQVLGKVTDYPVKMTNKVYWSHLWLHADTFLFRNIYKGREEQINSEFFDDNLITCYYIKYGNVIYIPNSMVIYRQIPGSSWNKRTPLQKAVVNMRVYSEAKKVLPEMKWYSFVKCHSAWKRFYLNRNDNIEANCTVAFVSHEKIVKDTLKYRKSGIAYKVYYEIKYFIPMHVGILIKIYKKLQKLSYQRI